MTAAMNARNLTDLQPHLAGQGHDWPDTDILPASGLKVRSVSNSDCLFEMQAAVRIDYFSRAINEIWRGWEVFRTAWSIRLSCCLT